MKIPNNFDGAKFAEKYNLEKSHLWIDGNGEFQCPSIPKLKESDLSDCILLHLTTDEKIQQAYKDAGITDSAKIEALIEDREGNSEKLNVLLAKRAEIISKEK